MSANRIYIGRLSHRAKDRDVEKLFKSYGRIREIVLKNGYGFVEFEDYRDADDAVYELNGRELAGERIVVEHAKGPVSSRDRDRDRDRSYSSRDRGDRGDRYSSSSSSRDGHRRSRGGGPPVWLEKYGPPTRTEYRVIIENLSTRVSWQDLKDYMRQAGEVTYADAHRPYKGEGVVEFATYSDMRTAIDKLDDTELGGKRIRVEEDKPRSSRRRSGSRSRSRSRSRSGSRSRSRSRSRSPRNSRSKSPRKSGSKSPRKSRSKSPRKSRSRSPRNGRSRSPRNDRSKSKSKSRSPARSMSPEKERDRSNSPKKSLSRSPSRGSKMSRSRSKSASPAQD